jgi:hypothetical protein
MVKRVARSTRVHWPAKGSRHQAFLGLAGVFARAKWNLEEAQKVQRVLYKCLWPGDPELGAADVEMTSTFAKAFSRWRNNRRADADRTD